MQHKLTWQGYSNGDRNIIIEEVKMAISNNDGCIMNFNMFSDLALNLSIEIEENRIHELYNDLSRVLNVSNFEQGSINPVSKKEWLVLLNISFRGGKGELKGEIPVVPG